MVSESVSDWLISLFANSKDPIAFADNEGNLWDVNKAFESLTGYSRQELVGKKTFMEITSPKYLAWEAEKVAKIIDTGIPQEYEKEYIRKDGSTVPILLNVFRVDGKEGKPIGVGATFKDLTNQKKAEKEIELLARFPQEHPSPVLRINIDGTVLYANEAGLPLLKKWDCGVDEKVPADWRRLVKNALKRDERAKKIEVDYDDRVFSLTVAPVIEGPYVNFYGQEITDERLSAKALRTSEEQFRRLVSGVKDYAIFSLDQNGLIMNWNEGAQRIKGYEAEEIIGRHFSLFHTQEDIDVGMPERELARAVERGSYEKRGRRVRKDGTIFWAEILLTVMFDDDARLKGFSEIARDISDRKLAEERVENLAKFPSENPFPVLRVGADGTVLYANNASTALLDDWKASVGSAVPGEWQELTAELLSKNEVKKGIDIRFGGRILTFSAVPIATAAYVNYYGADITERKEAEDQLKQSKELGEALNEISTGIAAVSDLNQLYEQVTRWAAEATGCESVAVMMGGEADWRLESVFGPLPLEVLKKRLSSPLSRPLDLAAKTRRTIVVDHALEDSRADLDWMQKLGIKSFVLAPLIVERQVVGILAFHYHTTQTKFTVNQIDFAGKLAAVVSLTVQNLESSAVKEMALADAQALRRLSERVSQTLNIDNILDLALTEAMAAVKIEHGCIYTFDENRDLVIKVQKRLTDDFLRAKSKIGPGEGCAGRAASEDEVFSPSERQHDFVCEDSKRLLGLDCLAAIPITVTGTTLGVLELFAPVHRRLSDRERGILVTMANQVAPALENANLYAAERHIASTLQEILLRVPEKIQGIDFGHLYRSAGTEIGRAGGDYYDLFELDNDRVGVVIGDVSGKGLGAAAFTALVKNAIKAYAYQNASPARVLAMANDAVLKGSAPATFVTTFFGIINKRSGAIDYCSAGHPPAIIKRKTGKVSILKTNSPAIGVFHDFEYVDGRELLAIGDILMLYTDGVTEARCPEDLFGQERLIEVLRTLPSAQAKEVPKSVFDKVLELAQCRLYDDVAILTVSLEERAQEKHLKKAA